MEKNKNRYNFNSKKEAFKYAIFFAIIGLIWIIAQRLYLLNYSGDIPYYNMIGLKSSLGYIIITSAIAYTFAYKRVEKARIINSEFINNLRETATVSKEKESYEILFKNQLSLIENLVKEIDLGVIGWNQDLVITSVNPYFLKITKYEKEDLLMRSAREILIEQEDIDYALKSLSHIFERNKAKKHGVKVRGKFGDILELSTYNMPIKDSREDTLGMLTFASDITESKNLERKLRHLAYYDDLTGLPNKHLLRKHLLKKSKEENLKVAILYIEIDDYKLANESLGHEESEDILKNIGNILYIDLWEEDYLARISENEFIIAVNNNIGKKELTEKSEKILEEILKPIYLDGSTIHLSAKIGISTYEGISKSLDYLIKEAHLALHHIRYNSERDYAFFNKKIGDRINKENYIIEELAKAIENKDFIPYFQPISYIENNKIIALETLIRWIHPEKGFISPMEFIPISEETGQIYEITDIILEKALAQKQIWNEKGFKDFKISVNISSKSFEKGNLELELKTLELLRKYDIQPEELILEITETAAIKYSNANKVLETFNRFRGIGIEIALDDFGTGNSSLARLNELPIKYLKLDGAFVSNIAENKEEQAIVKAVVDLAHTLELLVIAEGIETMEQGKTLLDIGCTVGQGYYLARPAPAEEIEKIFEIY